MVSPGWWVLAGGNFSIHLQCSGGGWTNIAPVPLLIPFSPLHFPVFIWWWKLTKSINSSRLSIHYSNFCLVMFAKDWQLYSTCVPKANNNIFSNNDIHIRQILLQEMIYNKQERYPEWMIWSEENINEMKMWPSQLKIAEVAWKKKKEEERFLGLQWDSNPWPLHSRCSALPAELWRYYWYMESKPIYWIHQPMKGMKHRMTWCELRKIQMKWRCDHCSWNRNLSSCGSSLTKKEDFWGFNGIQTRGL